jgi:DNA-binding CsgD family transcriptional regulator
MARVLDTGSPGWPAGDTVVPLRPLGRGMVRAAAEDPFDLGRMRRALTMLRDPGSTAQLVRRIPTAAATLGFDRVIYAGLSGGRWHPVASTGCASEAEPSGEPVAVEDRLAEYVVLTGSTPVIVDEACQERLLPVSWCASYLVVPVVERGTVTGLLHAGHRDPAHRPGAADREALWTFAEALGSCFASVRAAEALHDLVTRMTEVADGFTGSHDLGRVRMLDVAPQLTVRELEVLELMAAGQTNGQIARRLVITEGTVKSHVKRIMRKLRAANRAEAVAAWMRPSGRAPVVEGF